MLSSSCYQEAQHHPFWRVHLTSCILVSFTFHRIFVTWLLYDEISDSVFDLLCSQCFCCLCFWTTSLPSILMSTLDIPSIVLCNMCLAKNFSRWDGSVSCGCLEVDESMPRVDTVFNSVSAIKGIYMSKMLWRLDISNVCFNKIFSRRHGSASCNCLELDYCTCVTVTGSRLVATPFFCGGHC